VIVYVSKPRPLHHSEASKRSLSHLQFGIGDCQSAIWRSRRPAVPMRHHC